MQHTRSQWAIESHSQLLQCNTSQIGTQLTYIMGMTYLIHTGYGRPILWERKPRYILDMSHHVACHFFCAWLYVKVCVWGAFICNCGCHTRPGLITLFGLAVQIRYWTCWGFRFRFTCLQVCTETCLSCKDVQLEITSRSMQNRSCFRL